MRERVDLRVVGVDVLSSPAAADDVAHPGEHLVEAAVADPPRAARVGDVEAGVHDRRRRDDIRRSVQAVGERRIPEQLLRRDAARRGDRGPAVTRPEREHGEHRAELAEVHVPAREPVLLRREPGHEGGDRRGGGRREGRGDVGPAVRAEFAARRRPLEQARAEPVDHEEADVSRAGDLVGSQHRERHVPTGRAERRGDRCRQVDDAAAVVVRLHSYSWPGLSSLHRPREMRRERYHVGDCRGSRFDKR